jgi:hypothetical protein
MAKRSSSIGLIAVGCILTAQAFCQTALEMKSPDSLAKDFSSHLALPEAPTVQFTTQNESGNFVDGQSRFRAKSAGIPSAPRPTEFSRSVTLQRQESNIFAKYLKSSSTKQPAHYASESGLMTRATLAASGVLITKNQGGKARLNTAYFLRALTSVAADTASRPYWKRSRTEPLSDFGSTMGNAAGMNVLHEFAPALQQITKEHTPQFVFKLAQRIGR